ncbi:OmpA-like domain-containing protein [Desulfonema limicola]|uniref:OmpA-like domain-containing protein n=1 Tax=Desulfonema limicola TaxID=45656 RepID=A0A975B7P9_9BACT|nr:OmpA family protein [Desulfonema limicola]QTA80304.1 OmpA-like domain-containing protein [Desulfonema limicola]
MKKYINAIILLFLLFFCAGTIPAYGLHSEDDIVNMLVPKPKVRGVDTSGNDQPSVTFYLQFGLNSAELTPESIDQLRLLGNGLQRGELRNYVFKIEGHTCDLGNDNENLILSRKRALSVKKYLIDTFAIPAQQLETQGFGENRPAVSNTDEDSRKKNRRVVILNTLKTFKSRPRKAYREYKCKKPYYIGLYAIPQ